MCNRQRMHGAVSIEFALILGLFLAILYAIVSYALVFMLVQSFTSASEDGLRAAVAVDCAGLAAADCVDQRITPAVRTQALASLSWLPADIRDTVLGSDGSLVEVDCDGETCAATIRYADYLNDPMIPVIHLPLLGAVPRLPQDLIGSARLRI
jgi:hypothetical protein